MTSPEFIAAVFLSIVVLTVVALVVGAVLRSPFTPPQTLLFVTAYLLVRLRWRAKLPGRLPIPDGQGAVVVSNHRSSVDPFFIQVCCNRPVHFMVAREYCEHPAFRWFLKTSEVIPVNRGGVDTASTKAAIRLAAAGELVGMLPEGRINMSQQFMLPVRPGAALVALRARVPILPCYVDGSPYDGTAWSPLLMSAKARVVFGRPLDLSEYFDRQEEDGLVAELMVRVAREIARLAGCQSFEPQLAGRRWKPDEKELTASIEAMRQRS
jgi:1-acyl-sn-glycerol-3-phosphate acyltransferase